MEKAVTAFTVLKSLISGGFSEGNDDQDSGLSTPRTDVRGLVVMPIGMAVTSVTPGMIEGMVSAYESGTSLISIARGRRLGKDKVRDLLIKAGVRIRRQGLDNKQVAHALRQHKEVNTVRGIAREMAVGHSMVWRALNKVYFCRQLLDTQTSVVARLHA